MPYFTYDTSVIIARKLTDLRNMPQSFLMSSVVLMELMGRSSDPTERKAYEQLFRQYQKNELLIVPNDADWLLASRSLYLLTHARRRSEKGKLKPLPPGASQRLALDVLIAVSARRWDAQVVTENWKDFKAIHATAHHDRQGSEVLSNVATKSTKENRRQGPSLCLL